jgi:hypothetical protein
LTGAHLEWLLADGSEERGVPANNSAMDLEVSIAAGDGEVSEVVVAEQVLEGGGFETGHGGRRYVPLGVFDVVN